MQPSYDQYGPSDDEVISSLSRNTKLEGAFGAELWASGY